MTDDRAKIVLLVEDDEGHAELARRSLEQHVGLPVRLVHAPDGQTAMDYLRRQGAYANGTPAPRPHLILLDLRLPRVDGLEVLRQIKGDPELTTIPVVVLTTSDAPHDIREAYARHASSYLVKPLDYERFARQLADFATYWLVWNQYQEN